MSDREKNEVLLLDALKRNKLSHSYIFSGIEDVSYAVALAQKILCKQEHTGCGSCSSCLKIKSDNHPDLRVILPDGASIKNEQVEAFQSFMVIKPFESQRKIAIFNEVHLMTPRAQNRLLKILEEPPAYALILFMTKQPESLLDTVRSRCQLLTFYETGQIDTDILTKAIDFVKSIEFKDVNHILGFGSYAKEDKQRFPLFLRKVAEILRDIMVYKETGEMALVHPEHFTKHDQRGHLLQLSQKFKVEQLVTLIFLMEEVEQKLKSNMNFDLTVDQMLFSCIE
jgi:DNA polymerase-3 subunit delta'